ncbi:MAG: ion transporter [Bacteroidales bacterium]|nr:ion transporter [Bacteroidales bacterium]
MRPDPTPAWRSKMYDVIFEADTFEGKLFDVILLIAIAGSIIIVLLESVKGVRIRIGETLRVIEWTFTFLFSLEYILRIIVVRRPREYIFSFYGIVDFVAIIPTYLAFIFVGAQSLLIFRALRLLRIFRVFKMGRYVSEAKALAMALQASIRKILVFFATVLVLVLILGSIMYLVEGEDHGFSSIPMGIYWAIVTLTTVGFGDIVPLTVAGKLIANFTMLLGYAIIAIPTGIVTVEMARTRTIKVSRKVCDNCATAGHDINAKYCKHCGEEL